MLKNDYLELYLQKSKILSEFEKEIQQDDDNYILNLSRPLSTDKIKEFNHKNLFKFIDDLFCNQSINNLLFSSTANKELDLFLKTKRLTQNNNNKKSKNVIPTSYSLYFKREKKNTINKIKLKIKDFKSDRKIHSSILKKKNIKFIQQLKKESNNENIMKEINFPINEIRKKNFKRVLNKCMSLQEFNIKSFKLPNINIQLNNNLEITDNNLLKEKIFQFENFTKVGVMRNNGEIAQYYRMVNLNNDDNNNNFNNNNNNNNERINNFGGANFQAQLRSLSNPSNNRNNNIINNNENYNNNSRINIRIINNRNNNNNNNNRFRIEYLKSFSIAPSNYIKFNNNKTKIIKVNKFSIFHYNSFKPRTFETFTQTFPKYLDNKICKLENLNIENKKNKLINSINNFNKTKNSFNSSIINNKPIIKTSKIIINADKFNKNNNNKTINLKLGSNKLNINNNNKKNKYKLKDINKK